MSKLSNLKLDARQILIASLPSDLPDSFFCPPPAAKTESIQGLAALVDSGQAGGIPQAPQIGVNSRVTWCNLIWRVVVIDGPLYFVTRRGTGMFGVLASELCLVTG